MNIDISDLKPLIRSILLSLGRRASEHEFMTEYYNMEGSSFRMVLSRFGLNFWQFMSRMPDVCRVSRFADEVFVERVSTEASSHMDHLTIEKNRRRKNVTMRIPHYRPLFNFNHDFNSRFNSNPYRPSAPRPPTFAPTQSRRPRINLPTNTAGHYSMRSNQPIRATMPIMKTTVFKPDPPPEPRQDQSMNGVEKPTQLGSQKSLPVMKTFVFEPCTSATTSAENKTAKDVSPRLRPLATPQSKISSVSLISKLSLSETKTVDCNTKTSTASSKGVQPVKVSHRSSLPPMKTFVFQPGEPAPRIEEEKTKIRSPRQLAPIRTPSSSLKSKASSGSNDITQNSFEMSWLHSATSTMKNGFSKNNSDSSVYSDFDIDESIVSTANCSVDVREHFERTQDDHQRPTLNISRKAKEEQTDLKKTAPVCDPKNPDNEISSSDVEKSSLLEVIRLLDTKKEQSDISVSKAPRNNAKSLLVSCENGKRNELKQSNSAKIEAVPKELQNGLDETILLSNLKCGDLSPQLAKTVEESEIPRIFSIGHPHWLSKRFKDTALFEIEITEAVSPWCFIFKFHEKDFEELRHKMNIFYNNYKDDQDLIPEEFTENMTYATLYQDNWYRVQIKDVDKFRAIVEFVDLGQFGVVTLNKLRFLKKFFVQSSRKSAEGRLHGVKPADNASEWPQATCRAFSSKVEHVKLLASLKSRCENYFVLSLFEVDSQHSSVEEFMISMGLGDIQN